MRPSLLLLLTACAGDKGPSAGSKDSAEPAEDSGPIDDTGEPCTAIAAVFFDLGETLVTERSDGLFEALPGAVEALATLDARGVPTGIITNVGPDWTRADLEALLVDPSLLDAVDVLLLSSEASAPKPDPAIFIEAVALLSPAPNVEQTAFVTESLRDLADASPPTEGAQAAGLFGVWLHDGTSDSRQDLQWSPAALAALPDALSCLPTAP